MSVSQSVRGVECAAMSVSQSVRGSQCAAVSARQSVRGSQCATFSVSQSVRGVECVAGVCERVDAVAWMWARGCERRNASASMQSCRRGC
jgi:hypothetical protein